MASKQQTRAFQRGLTTFSPRRWQKKCCLLSLLSAPMLHTLAMQHPQEARAVHVRFKPTRDGAQAWKICWLAACLLSACTGTIEPSNRPGLSDIGAAGAAAGAAGTGFNNLPIAGNGV